MTYDAGRPCCDEYVRLTLKISELEQQAMSNGNNLKPGVYYIEQVEAEPLIALSMDRNSMRQAIEATASQDTYDEAAIRKVVSFELAEMIASARVTQMGYQDTTPRPWLEQLNTVSIDETDFWSNKEWLRWLLSIIISAIVAVAIGWWWFKWVK